MYRHICTLTVDTHNPNFSDVYDKIRKTLDELGEHIDIHIDYEFSQKEDETGDMIDIDLNNYER